MCENCPHKLNDKEGKHMRTANLNLRRILDINWKQSRIDIILWGYLHLELLRHISQLQLDPDYECEFPTAFSALQGHPGFEIQGYTYVPSLKNKGSQYLICITYDFNLSLKNCQ